MGLMAAGSDGARGGPAPWLRLVLIACAVGAGALPHLLAAAGLSSLDYVRARPGAIEPAEEAAENFPGSAFFFAENAFSQSADVKGTDSNIHVMPLERVEAAPAVTFLGATPLDRARALQCMTNAIYYEAANEPDDGQRAVAQVILNRVRHPAWPNSVCGVIYQGTERTDLRCQFTFSCDGSMSRRADPAKWERARRVAMRALSGDVYAPVGTATFYHTLAVRPPWAPSLDPVAVVGAHIFYKLRGQSGTPVAFSDAYARREYLSGPSINAYVRPRTLPARAEGYAAFDIPVAPLPVPAAAYAPGKIGMASPAPSLLGGEAPAAPPPSGWTPYVPPRAVAERNDALPESTIRPEFRDSGRPLF